MATRRINLYCQILCLKRILWDRAMQSCFMVFFYISQLLTYSKDLLRMITGFRRLCQLMNTLNAVLRMIRILKLSFNHQAKEFCREDVTVFLSSSTVLHSTSVRPGVHSFVCSFLRLFNFFFLYYVSLFSLHFFFLRFVHSCTSLMSNLFPPNLVSFLFLTPRQFSIYFLPRSYVLPSLVYL